jgi:hypothetical protein
VKFVFVCFLFFKKTRCLVDFIALDAQKEQLLLENAALKEGLSSVQRKV